MIIVVHITHMHNFAHADGTPTMPELTQLNVASKWGHIRIKDRIAGRFQDVGTCLLNDKNGNMLDSIERDHDRVHDRVAAMFRLWLQSKGHTWSQLIECLNVAQFQFLADEIKSVFCGRKRVTVVDPEHYKQPFEEKRVEPTTSDSIDLDMAYPSKGINKPSLCMFYLTRYVYNVITVPFIQCRVS